MKRFSFFTKGILAVLFLFVGLQSGWAEEQASYTLTSTTFFSFKANNISTSTPASTLFSAGTDYVKTSPVASVEKGYYGLSNPIRIGTSSSSGSLTLNLSDAGQVYATMIEITAKRYSTNKSAQLNCNNIENKEVSSNNYTAYKYTFTNPTKITQISLSSTKGVYIKSITVYYKKYNITCNTVTGGKVTADPTTSPQDKSITLNTEASNGYELSGLKVSNQAGNTNVTISPAVSASKSTYTFTMPAYDVWVTPTFKAKTYKINYEGCEGATNNNPKTYTVEDDDIFLSDPTKDGYVFVGWTSDDYQDPTKGAKITKGSTGDKTFTANWHKIYTIKCTNDGNGTLTSSPQSSAEEGTEVTLTAKPISGYELSTLTFNKTNIDAEKQSDGSYIYKFNISTDVEANATFAKLYTITCNSATGGSVSASPTSSASGKTITLTVSPLEGYELSTLKVTDEAGTTSVTVSPEVSASNTTYTFTMPNYNVKVSAYFKKQYSITCYSATGGSVSASPTSSVSGKSITLTVTQSTGYEISDLKVTNEAGTTSVTVSPEVSASNTTYTFTMPSYNVYVTPTFKAKTYTITCSTDGNGTLTTSSNTVNYGTSVTLTATPNLGYELSLLTVNGEDVTDDVTPEGTYTIDNVFAKVTAVATFKKANLTDSNGKAVVADKTYRITSMHDNRYLTVYNDGTDDNPAYYPAVASLNDVNDNNMKWQFIKSGSTYAIKNVGTGEYIQHPWGNDPKTLSSDPAYFTTSQTSFKGRTEETAVENEYCFHEPTTNDDNVRYYLYNDPGIYTADVNKVFGWTNGTREFWVIEEVIEGETLEEYTINYVDTETNKPIKSGTKNILNHKTVPTYKPRVYGWTVGNQTVSGKTITVPMTNTLRGKTFRVYALASDGTKCYMKLTDATSGTTGLQLNDAKNASVFTFTNPTYPDNAFDEMGSKWTMNDKAGNYLSVDYADKNKASKSATAFTWTAMNYHEDGETIYFYQPGQNSSANGYIGLASADDAVSTSYSTLYADRSFEDQSIPGSSIYSALQFFLEQTHDGETCTIKYDANGGSGTVPADQTYTFGDTSVAIASGDGLTKSGYTFVGWATTADGDAKYYPGNTDVEYDDVVDGTLHLYAAWVQMTDIPGTPVAGTSDFDVDNQVLDEYNDGGNSTISSYIVKNVTNHLGGTKWTFGSQNRTVGTVAMIVDFPNTLTEGNIFSIYESTITTTNSVGLAINSDGYLQTKFRNVYHDTAYTTKKYTGRHYIVLTENNDDSGTSIYIDDSTEPIMTVSDLYVSAVQNYMAIGTDYAKYIKSFYVYNTDERENIATLMKALKSIPARTYTVSFDANGGTGKVDPITVRQWGSATLPDGSGFSKNLYKCDGWAKSANGDVEYKAGDQIHVSKNTTLYAHWTTTPYYIQNVKTGKFIARGNYYGTRAVVDDYGTPFNFTPTSGSSSKYYITAVDGGGSLGDDGWMYAYHSTSDDNVGTYTLKNSNGIYTIHNSSISDESQNVYVYLKDDYKYCVAANSKKDENYTDDEQTQWRFLTQEERDAYIANKVKQQESAIASLAGHTVTTTLAGLVSDTSNFEAETKSTVSTSDWTFTAVRDGSKTSPGYGLIECFQGTGNFTKTLTGLEEGIYKITIPALYRDGSNGTCWENEKTNGYKGLSNAYIAANGYAQQIATWASEATDATETSYYKPNSMSEASDAFNEGKYTNTIYTYVGADGEMNLTIAVPSYIADGWFITGDATVTYYKDKTTVSDEKANEILEEAAKLNAKKHYKELHDALNAAYEAFKNDKTVAKYYALRAAINNSTPSIAIYDKFKSRSDYNVTRVKTFDEKGQEEYPKAVYKTEKGIKIMSLTEALAAYNDETMTDGVTETKTLRYALGYAAIQQTTPGSDMTDIIENASCTEATGWNVAVPGWGINTTADKTNFHGNNWSGTTDDSGMSTPYLEWWIGNDGTTTLPDATISNTINLLEGHTGSYTVKAKVRMVNETWTGTSTPTVEGVKFYVQENNDITNTVDPTENATTITSNDGNAWGLYKEISFKFDVIAQSSRAFGFIIENANINWLSFKDVQLIFDEPLAEPNILFTHTESTRYNTPALTQTKDGKIIAVVNKLGTEVTALGEGEVDLVTRSSQDGTKWEEESTIETGNSDKSYGDAALVADRESGNVLMMSGYATATNQDLYSGQQQSAYRVNNGTSWGSPTAITAAAKASLIGVTGAGAAFTSGNILQSQYTKTGDYYRLYSTLYATQGKTSSTSTNKKTSTWVVYSDDFGKSWSVLGGTSAAPIVNGHEGKVEELPDGRIVVSSRVNDDAGGNTGNQGRYFNMFTYTNTKDAEGTWDEAQKNMTIAAKDSIGTNGSIVIVPAKDANDKDVYIALQSAPAGGYGLTPKPWAQTHLTIYYKVLDEYADFKDVLTLKEGWIASKDLSGTKSARSSMILQNDGTIGLLYEETSHQDDYKDTSSPYNNDYDIIYSQFNLRQLTQGKYNYNKDIDRPTFVRNYFYAYEDAQTTWDDATKEEFEYLVAQLADGITTEELDAIFSFVAKPVINYDGKTVTLTAEGYKGNNPYNTFTEYIYNSGSAIGVSSYAPSTTSMLQFKMYGGSNGGYTFQSAYNTDYYLNINSSDNMCLSTTALEFKLTKWSDSGKSNKAVMMDGYALQTKRINTSGNDSILVAISSNSGIDKLNYTTKNYTNNNSTYYTTDFTLSVKSHKIICIGSEDGSIWSVPTDAMDKETVTLYNKPARGRIFVEYRATYIDNGTEKELKLKETNGIFTFSMPGAMVTVTGVWGKKYIPDNENHNVTIKGDADDKDITDAKESIPTGATINTIVYVEGKYNYTVSPVNNVVVGNNSNTWTCENFVLQDFGTDTYRFGNTHEFTAEKVSYSRPAASTGDKGVEWGTVYLPYAPVKKTGYTYFDLAEAEKENVENVAVLKFKEAKELKANTPYLVKNVNYKTENYNTEGSNVTIATTDTAPDPASIDTPTENPEKTSWYMVGTYKRTRISKDEETKNKYHADGYLEIYNGLSYYVLSDGTGFISVQKTSKGFFNISPFRAYFYTDNPNVGDAKLGMCFEEEDTDGIRIVENQADGTVDMIFDISGRRLNEPKKGVNIINGKKVLVK